MLVAEQLSKFVVDTTYADFPPQTVQFAKELTLKCIAGMVAGSKEPVGKVITKYVREMGGVPEAGVIGGGFRVPVQSAALALGTFAHAAELEDDQVPGLASTITLLPVILPLATERFVELFRKYAKGAYSKPQIERIIEIVLDLENQKDISELMDTLSLVSRGRSGKP